MGRMFYHSCFLYNYIESELHRNLRSIPFNEVIKVHITYITAKLHTSVHMPLGIFAHVVSL